MKSRVLLFAVCFVAMLAANVSRAGELNVVDSTGTVVGHEYSPGNGGDQAVLKIKGVWVALYVNAAGFVPNGAELYYTTGDCSGTAYFPVGNVNQLSIQSNLAGTTAYFPDPSTAQVKTIVSEKGLAVDGSIFEPCTSSNEGTLAVGPVLTYNLTRLGLVPPFSLK